MQKKTVGKKGGREKCREKKRRGKEEKALTSDSLWVRVRPSQPYSELLSVALKGAGKLQHLPSAQVL